MKAKLIFNMDDSDDIQKFERYCKADDMADIIWRYLRNSRKTIQQEIANAEGEITASEAVDKCFEKFYELLEENDLNIDKLWS